jgi:hypothetical protein
MTIEEWNQLRPGDLIQHKKDPSIRYMVHALGEEIDLSDDLTDPRPMMSRNLWIDPLLPPDDPFYPDITEYEPGDCDHFERGELKGELKPMTRDEAKQIMQNWYEAWYAQRSPYCQRLTDQEQRELWHAHLRELIRTKDPEMLAGLRRALGLTAAGAWRAIW